MTRSPTALRGVFETYLASKQPATQAAYLHSLSRLEAWAERETLSIETLEARDLKRFLAEEGRQSARSTINIRYAAVRAYYKSLHQAGIVKNDSSQQLQALRINRSTSSGAIADLGEDEVTYIRMRAKQLGAIHSLAVCLLHETPISLAGVARLTLGELAEDFNRPRTYLLLGKTTKKTPWPITTRAREAIDALRTEHPRLISPTTKNPNHLLVRAALEETRIDANIQAPDLAAALKGAQRRKEHELCEQLRLGRRRLAVYRRNVLPRLRALSEN
jgi:site-specific recombinase XerD